MAITFDVDIIRGEIFAWMNPFNLKNYANLII